MFPTPALWDLLPSAYPPSLWFCNIELLPLSALSIIKGRILGFIVSLFKASVSIRLHSFINSPPVLCAFLSFTEMLRQKLEAQRRRGRRCSRHQAGDSLVSPREDHPDPGFPPAAHGEPWWSKYLFIPSLLFSRLNEPSSLSLSL